jgi:L-serine kinase (ATP) / ParB family transcriptional regulator, heme-responsive regulator
MGEPFDLRVVPLASVVPHEEHEPRRVARIVERLASDTMLSNPPLVVEHADQLILLDGANRIAALRVLDYRYAIVQVAPAASVRLAVWHHALLDTTPDRLLDTLAEVPAIALLPTAQATTAQATAAGELCVLGLADGRRYGVLPRAGTHAFAALNALVGAYLDRAVIRRTTVPDLAVHPDAAAVVAFPQLSTAEVFAAVQAGVRLPAGITRFVVAGRVLLLNATLEPLRSERPVAELNEWLRGLVAGRRAQARIRHYPEAVYVLDD